MPAALDVRVTVRAVARTVGTFHVVSSSVFFAKSRAGGRGTLVAST
jgi:hypothetical protein